MPVPDLLYRLVAEFHDNLPRYRGADYNETEVRVQFINPLIEELGWDMADRAASRSFPIVLCSRR